MKDQDKTREQLISEFGELRQRIAELEAAEAERRRVEQQLRILSSVVEQSADSIVIIDREGKVEYANPTFLQLNEFDPDEVIGKNWRSFVPPYSTLREKYPEIQETVLGREATWRGEMTTRARSGEVIWREATFFPIKDAEGEMTHIVYMSVNVTERKRAEEALRENEEKLRAQFRGIPIPTYTWQRSGDDFVLVDCNDAALAITQGKIANFVGIRATEMYRDAPDILEKLSQCYARRVFLEHETFYRFKTTGESKHLAVKYAFVPPDLVLAHGEDITGRKQAEQALRESEQRFRQMAEGIREVFWMTEPESSRILYVSPAYESIWQRSIEDLHKEPRAWMAPIHPDDVATVSANWEEQVQGVSTHEEFRITRPDGSTRWIENRAYPIISEDGQVRLVTGVAEDITERKQVEEALKRSEATLKSIFRAAPIGIGLVVNRVFQWTNDTLHKMVGYSADELKGKNARMLYPSDEEYERVGREKYAEIAEGGTGTIETCIRCKDGSVIDVLLSSTPLDPTDLSTGVTFTALDITERKQMEKALRESEEKFRNLAEQSPNMIFINKRGKVVYANRRCEEMTGYTRDRFYSADFDFLSLIAPEHRESIKASFSRHMKGKEVEPYEYAIITRDGKRVETILTTKLIEYEGERAILGTVSDITERKQVEEERERLLAQIREQAQRTQQIVDTVPEGVLLLDADECIILVNPVAGKDLPVLTEARVGDAPTHLGDRPLAELLTSPPKGLWHEVAADGRTFQVIARSIETGPTPAGWVMVIRDVTQQRQIQQRVQQQERLAAVGQLAAGIAHDFNNIMAAIVLYAQMTARMEGLPSVVGKRMETIDEQAKHATKLIQQILDFSRQTVLERRPLDLAPLLKEHVRLLERTLPESIEIRLDYEPDEYVVNADPTRMQQMITNLALNAREAMRGGGELRIGLGRIEVKPGESPLLPEMEAGEWVRLTVTDTGTGIPPDALPHIFEPFFTTRAPLGSGLGLAQVHGIVGAHEGRIDVETQVGQGTTFTIYLPVHPSEPSTVPTRAELPALPIGQGETILVVEDDAVVRKALADSLKLLNYRVLEVANGQEALEMLERRQGEVALVLSDVVMPQMGGIALLHALRERKLAVPVVMLTGHPMQREMEELRAQGMADWLPKPPQLDQLAKVVTRALSTD